MSEKTINSQPPIRVGLTGSIGSGKSTVASIFQSLGIPIYFSDQEAKKLMNNDAKLKAKIQAAFGEKIYSLNGTLDRKKLAEIVFNNPGKLQRLNSLVHPAVKVNFEAWIQRHQSFPYLIKEAAILLESKANKGLNRIICVTAPASLRRQRVIARDDVSLEQVKAREANQWTEAEKARQSHYIISNDQEHSLISQVIGIHKLLLASGVK